jgi:tripartite-type tricarboxylate transporter receptor subunit TctC
MVEAGIAGYEATAWFGMVAPAAVPRDIISKLNQEVGRILQLPDVLVRISQQGSAEIIGGTPEQFGEFIRSEVAKWSRVVKAAGVKPE